MMNYKNLIAGKTTSADLLKEVRLHGISTDQNDLNGLSDIIGNMSIIQLETMLEDDQNTTLFILSKVWPQGQVIDFYNKATGKIDRQTYEELKEKYCYIEKDLQASEKMHNHYKKEFEKAAEQSETIKELKIEIEAYENRLKAANLEILQLKAKLYDMLQVTA